MMFLTSIWIPIVTLVTSSYKFVVSVETKCASPTNYPVCRLYDDTAPGQILYEDSSISSGAQSRPCVVLHDPPPPKSAERVQANIITTGNKLAEYFAIRQENYTLFARYRIDREELCERLGQCCNKCPECIFLLNLAFKTPRPNGPLMTFTQLNIKLIDTNDNSPQFPREMQVIEVSESTKVGSKIPIPSARDPDSKANNIGKYRLETSELEPTFELVEDASVLGDKSDSRLYLRVQKKLDWETQNSYTMTLIAEDRGSPSKTGSMTVKIQIRDENDNHPAFLNKSYVVRVSESVEIGHLLTRVKAVDPDEGSNGQVIYSFGTSASPKVNQHFQINSQTGAVTTIDRLDYETDTVFSIPVTARDRGGHPTKDEALVTVYIEDENDTPPQIHMDHIPGKIKEGPRRKVDLHITTLVVKDPEGEVDCRLEETRQFKLDLSYQSRENAIYQLILNGSLDYEKRRVEKMRVCCTDRGLPPKMSCKPIAVDVEDVNDNAPYFAKSISHVFLPENNKLDVAIARLVANDKDSGRNAEIQYTLRGEDAENFLIGVNDGVLRPKRRFEREERSEYRIVVYAKDLGNPSLSATTNVVVQIRDVNDNAPVFQGLHETGSYLFNVRENQPRMTRVGTVRASDRDEGENKRISYSISSHYGPFQINSETGEIMTTRRLDREKKQMHEIPIIATDHGNPALTTTVTATILVDDVNDHPPRILFPTSRNNSVRFSYHEHAGQIVLRIEARDEDYGENAILHYEIVSGNHKALFRVDSSSGDVLIDREMTSADVGRYPLKIIVQDQGENRLSTMVDFVINVDTSSPRYPLVDPYPKPNPSRSYTSAILVIIVALICAIILVLLSMTVYLCGKKGLISLDMLKLRRHTSRVLCCCCFFCCPSIAHSILTARSSSKARRHPEDGLHRQDSWCEQRDSDHNKSDEDNDSSAVATFLSQTGDRRGTPSDLQIYRENDSLGSHTTAIITPDSQLSAYGTWYKSSCKGGSINSKNRNRDLSLRNPHSSISSPHNQHRTLPPARSISRAGNTDSEGYVRYQLPSRRPFVFLRCQSAATPGDTTAEASNGRPNEPGPREGPEGARDPSVSPLMTEKYYTMRGPAPKTDRPLRKCLLVHDGVLKSSPSFPMRLNMADCVYDSYDALDKTNMTSPARQASTLSRDSNKLYSIPRGSFV